MATIENLKKSITEMSHEEVLQTIRAIRNNRRKLPKEKKTQPKKTEKKAKKEAKQKLTPAMAARLLEKLGG